jgi:hypothetical protein
VTRTVIFRAGATAAALLALAALPACPVPQPVAEYPATGVVPPPQLLMDEVTPIDTVIYVNATGCASAVYTLSTSLVYADTTKAITARWFVDYDTSQQNSTVRQQDDVPVDGGAPDPTIRVVPSFAFDAYGWLPTTAGSLHVVEVVVSNGFAQDPVPLPAGWRPNRTPSSQFQTQTYRWVFSYVATGGTCGYP